MRTPTEKQFSLNKVSKIAGGCLDVHFSVEEKCGDEIYNENYHLTSTKEIHPDLNKLFDRLKPALASVYNMSFFRYLIDTDQFNATPEQKAIASSAYSDILTNIYITGIVLSGTGEKLGIIITGMMNTGNLTTTKLNIKSHRIVLSNNTYGFEDEVRHIAEEIEYEVYAFLFKGKKAQLELFPEELE